MNRKMNDYIASYKQQLEIGDIQIAYAFLIKYIMALKSSCEKKFTDRYSFGNVSDGYMDYTYFPFSNTFLRERKLRFGIVLNHKIMRFELWLMGRNAKVQKEYWNLLKTSEWNKAHTMMPKYSVLETVLVEHPDFNETDTLTTNIIKAAETLSSEIISYIKNNI